MLERIDTTETEGWQSLDGEEIKQYVPDVFCPYCSQEIHLDKVSYAFYDAESGCPHFGRRFHLKTGGFNPKRDPYVDRGARGPGAPTTVPYFDGASRLVTRGHGLLLAIEPIAPVEVVQGVKSPPVPEEAYKAVLGAIKCLEIAEYESSAGRSRFAIQAALLHMGIPDQKSVMSMVYRARDNGKLSDIAVSRCVACIFIGNSGGHPQVELIRRIGRDDAVEGLRLARRVLLELYDGPSITDEN